MRTAAPRRRAMTTTGPPRLEGLMKRAATRSYCGGIERMTWVSHALGGSRAAAQGGWPSRYAGRQRRRAPLCRLLSGAGGRRVPWAPQHHSVPPRSSRHWMRTSPSDSLFEGQASPPKEKTMINEYLRTIRTSNRNRILMATALERCGDLLFVATTQLSKANKTSFDPNVAYLCAL